MVSFEQDPTDPTGIRDLTPRGNTEVTRARSRKANAALELALEGQSWDDIAAELGFPSGRTAQAAVERALEKGIFTDTSQKALRSLASRRLEKLNRAVWKHATNPEDPDLYAAQAQARANIDRWIKLHGLDAPQQHVIHSPTASELERWVAEAIALRQPVLEEPDVLELDPADYTETDLGA